MNNAHMLRDHDLVLLYVPVVSCSAVPGAPPPRRCCIHKNAERDLRTD